MSNNSRASETHHVVIVGGGFAGLSAAKALSGADCRVTLLDRRNFHLFQPLLYQVATGALSPANIAAPLRSVVKAKHVQVLLGEVEQIDLESKRLTLHDGDIAFDNLVVATGSTHNYFGNDDWARHAPGLKSIEDATTIRRRILLAYEAAEREADEGRRAKLLTFVAIGGGPTGVEMAGAMAEISRMTLRKDFRVIDPTEARVLLLEGAPRLLPMLPESLSDLAKRSLESLGVEVHLDTMATEIGDGYLVADKDGEELRIESEMVLWSAGVKASALGEAIAEQAGVELDRGGRVPVDEHCRVGGRDDLYVIGDLARFEDEQGEPLPGLAAVARQQGRYLGKRIKRRLKGKPTKGFRYRDRGEMATIGRKSAVADLRWGKLWGWPGWLVWLFVHLMYIVDFKDRLVTLAQWAANYFTGDRSARLITGDTPWPLVRRHEIPLRRPPPERAVRRIKLSIPADVRRLLPVSQPA